MKALEKWFYIVTIAGFFGIIILVVQAWGLQAQANATDITQLKQKVDRDQAQFEEIRLRLAHIEDAVGVGQ